jgi:hypothetical protein
MTKLARVTISKNETKTGNKYIVSIGGHKMTTVHTKEEALTKQKHYREQVKKYKATKN